MLKWKFQGHNECWITALSIVTGVEVDTLRAKFESSTGVAYPKTFPPTWFKIANGILRDANARTTCTFTLTSRSLIDYPTSSLEGHTYYRRLGASLLTGRGILTFYYGRTGHTGHTVAFENSFIVDTSCRLPENQRLLSYKEWRALPKMKHKRIKNWRIDRF